MDPRMRPAAPRLYETFDPQTESVAEEGSVTFLVYLPEFRKEQLKVQLSSSRVLRISGERPLEDGKWKRFVKEVGVPGECDTKGIVAKFDSGILYVKQPKLVTPAAEPEPTPAPTPTPEPTNTPEDKMEEDPRKEGKEADETTTEGADKEKGKSTLDEHGVTSGDAGNAKNEEDIDRDEEGKGRCIVADEHGQVIRGGRFEEVMLNKNAWKMVVIAAILVALVVRMIYT